MQFEKKNKKKKKQKKNTYSQISNMTYHIIMKIFKNIL